jgi:sirohydrochlorin ferrochelatase
VVDSWGLLVVGHGSRRPEANATLREVADRVGDHSRWRAVQAAFLELTDPDILDGYGKLVTAGCRDIVVHPFFLFPGTHTTADIPRQLAAAAQLHPGARWRLTEPLGLHPGVLRAAADRITEVLPG